MMSETREQYRERLTRKYDDIDATIDSIERVLDPRESLQTPPTGFCGDVATHASPQSIYEGKATYCEGRVSWRRIATGAISCIVFAFIVWLATSANGQDRPSSRMTKNVVVGAPSRAIALEALDVAELARRDICLTWLGYELRPGQGFADVHLSIEQDDKAKTWLANHSTGRLSMVWVEGPTAESLWPQLRHEMTHVVLDEVFQGECPRWLHEGVACRYDGDERKAIRKSIINDHPRVLADLRLNDLLLKRTIIRTDHVTYVAAESLVDHLVSLKDEQAVIEFTRCGIATNYGLAAQRVYGCSLREIERGWIEGVTK